MAKEKVEVCSICGEEYVGWGNNAWPMNEGRCCDSCNTNFVIPARIAGCTDEKDCFRWITRALAKSFKETDNV